MQLDGRIIATMTLEHLACQECKPQRNGIEPGNLPQVLPDHQRAIDITSETCPMTFVRTRLALDQMQVGEVLLVRLKGADPIANVPRAAADQGHEPLDLLTQADGTAILVLRKGG